MRFLVAFVILGLTNVAIAENGNAVRVKWRSGKPKQVERQLVIGSRPPARGGKHHQIFAEHRQVEVPFKKMSLAVPFSFPFTKPGRATRASFTVVKPDNQLQGPVEVGVVDFDVNRSDSSFTHLQVFQNNDAPLSAWLVSYLDGQKVSFLENLAASGFQSLGLMKPGEIDLAQPRTDGHGQFWGEPGELVLHHNVRSGLFTLSRAIPWPGRLFTDEQGLREIAIEFFEP